MMILFAACGAIIDSVSATFTKHLTSGTDVVTLTTNSFLAGSIFLLPTFFLVESPQVDHVFWITLALSSFVNALGIVLLFRAYQLSDLSVIAPLNSFCIIYTMIFAALMLGEIPSAPAAIGIALVFLGCYFICYESGGILKPFQNLLSEKGFLSAVLAHLFFSLNASIDKIGIQHSSALFFTPCLYIGVTLVLIVFVYMQRMKHSNTSQPQVQFSPAYSVNGFFMALASVCLMLALSFGYVIYVISVLRLKMFFNLVFARLFLGESVRLTRFLSVFVILIGVNIVIFLG